MARTQIRLYGGVNEIGGNKFLVEEGEARLFLDFGTSIGARNLFFEEFLQPRTNSILRDLLRLDLLPRIDGIYREDMLTIARAHTDKDLPESATEYRRRNGGKDFLAGVLITHAHVDHFQDLSFLDPEIPIYCTPTTKKMLEAIAGVGGVDVQSEIVSIRPRIVGTMGKTSKFGEGTPKVDTDDARPRVIYPLPEGYMHDIGGFRVLPIPVDHSVPGACAFFIITPAGKRIFYSGDVRFHGRLKDRTTTLLETAGRLKPDVMLCEGTRINSTSKDDEEGVERGITDLVKGAQGLVVAEFGWKDTTRFDTLQRVAEATGRKLLIDPRLAYLLYALDAHKDVPSKRIERYGNVGVYLRRKKSLLGSEADYDEHELGYKLDWGDRAKDFKAAHAAGDEAYLSEALAHYRNGTRAPDVVKNPDKYIVHLSFWSSAELFDLAPPNGSRWVRCATEPYNPEMAMDLRRQRTWLDHFGLEHNVRIEKGEEGLLGGVTHVSGHGSQQDIHKLIQSTAAPILVPVHTSEENLDHFAGLSSDVRTFRGATYRKAAKGDCFVEL